MTPARAIRQPECVRIRQRRMAPHVMTATPVPKPTLVRRESAPDQIRSPVRRAINVTTPAHAIPQPEYVRTHQRRMAPRVTMATPAPRPTAASREHALDPIQSPARPATSVTMPEHAIHKLAFVRTHKSRTALRVTTEMFVPQQTAVRAAPAPAHRLPAMGRLELKAIGRIIPKRGARRRYDWAALTIRSLRPSPS